VKPLLFAPLVLALAACGGGGSAPVAGSAALTGIPGTTPSPVAGIPTATAAPGANVAGTVVQIPVDAYGPATMGAVTYASADATQTAPLANATIIIGPVPITGATAPAQLPAGDVSTITTASGTFAASLNVAPAPSSSAEPFVIPPDNIIGFAPPATGYYVEVFGAGTDGKSAGVPIPLHRFVASTTSIILRVSSTSSAEADALATVNVDRAANGAGPLIFDESAEEVARAHASDESAVGYTCHYDTHNVGPSSRYLAVGGVGLTGEGLALVSGSGSIAFGNTEHAFMSEKSANPPGGHYLNLIDPGHLWAGFGANVDASAPAFANVDYDLVTPNAVDSVVGAYGYPTSGVCPGGIVVNMS
jgi:uncharacterized protein YkwD